MFEEILAVFRPAIFFPWILSMAFGVLIGGTPGLTATMGVALIIPVTYYMEPLAGMAMILGVSFTSIFTGDIPATLLRIPGTPASGAATLDGYELTKQGRGMEALSIDLLCSAIGGFIGMLLLMAVAPPLARFALKFTNFQYFWLGIFGLSMSAVLSAGRPINGVLSATLGLLVSTVGMDITTGLPRFTGGNMELLEGIGFIPAMVGLFGLSEVLKNVGDAKLLGTSSIPEFGRISLWETLKIILRNKLTVLKASILGTCVGALPGAGADIAAWVAYGMEKKTSKHPEEFGKGSIKGVIAPTSANNAALGGTWIPALVFGVPGDSITAIVLGAMLMYGLRPGPLIFQENLKLVHGIFAVGLISQFLLIPVGLIGIRVFGKILRMPRNIVMVIVLIFSVIGSYAIRNSFFDIYIMAAFGVAGFFFEYLDIPLPPLILAIILGPMIEDNLRVGLIKTHGGLGKFIFDPICLTLIILIFFVFFGGPVMKFFRRGRKE
ncbi:tripartite tricarboxylate transporter permease [Aminivibrio sp.]|jgi:TctA family transporter|uniref:tripartite tricarboxylate transporter permease n=1 Tax=Aminivibrio sp. TaxID=1872489 RepID=UPI001A619E67|nr:tripartite tricarboxylate transporter permease [Aminivibrio sp.]MBL3538523.1 tripartite tricarboxylate transporter permease [Aminivibrio sp.]MDK2958108.1 putative tricarboxylic transport rane protein [Synergistaceae bacterium]